jgi:hypothetical protein
MSLAAVTCGSVERVLGEPAETVTADTRRPSDPGAPAPVALSAVRLEETFSPVPGDQDAHSAGLIDTKVSIGHCGHFPPLLSAPDN